MPACMSAMKKFRDSRGHKPVPVPTVLEAVCALTSCSEDDAWGSP